MNDDLPPRDHNRPPTPALARADELVIAANSGLLEIGEAIRDDEVAGRAQGFSDQLRDSKADLEAELKAEIAPYEAIIVTSRLRYRDPITLIDLARSKLQPLLDAWLDKVRKRNEDKQREAEQAAFAAQADADHAAKVAEKPGATLEQQLAAMRAQEQAEALRAKANKAPKPAQIKGEFSKKAMSLRTYWSAEITDVGKALVHYADNSVVFEALLRAASADARERKDEKAAPPGVRFIRKERAQ